MNKPNDYDNTRANGGYTPVELGGHTCVIKQVNERKNKNGGDMIVVLIDFDKQDKQSGYFMDSFNKDIRPEKKYPNDGTVYINVNNRDGNCSKQFKGFCDNFEKSNNVKINWTDSKWCDQFKNKKIGAVYGEVEEIYNGEIKTKHKLRWFCEYDKADKMETPRKVEVSDDEREKIEEQQIPKNGFTDAPTGISDELPFA